MNDFKSKLPDLKELAAITNKLYTDMKKSVGEIVQSYKENRAQQARESEQAKTQEAAKEEAKTENKPVQEESFNSQEHTPEAPKTDDIKKE